MCPLNIHAAEAIASAHIVGQKKNISKNNMTFKEGFLWIRS